MKKRILLPFIALGALFCVGFGTIEYKQVRAEGEEPEVVEPVQDEEQEEEAISYEEKVAETQEELAKYKELYEKALEEYNKISNYQFLGTTVGALLGGLITLSLNLLINKVSKEKLSKGLEDMKRYSDFMGEKGNVVTSYIEKAENYIEHSEEKYEAAVKLAEDTAANMQKQAEAFAEEKAQIVKSRLEERQFFIEIVSHSKEMVSSGAAEKIVKYFQNKED